MASNNVSRNDIYFTLYTSSSCHIPSHSYSTYHIMSGLAKDAAAFKSTLHRQDYTSWHSQPKPLNTESSSKPSPSKGSPSKGLAVADEASSSSSHKKAKRPKTSMLAFCILAIFLVSSDNLS